MPDASNIENILADALRRQSFERAAFLDEVCGGNAALRAAVEARLRGGETASDALDANALHIAASDGSAESTWSAETYANRSRDNDPNMVIGRYRLLHELGEGGFGVVWLAEQREPVVRKVALKIIKLGMDTRQVVARFEQERQALALMNHPNIAKVLDAGATEAGRPYFVMELVRGDPITKYCDTHKLSTHERLELFVQVCQAIQHAHQKGIIHRDLKPSNVLVMVEDGRPLPKVIDFGIAKATYRRLTEKTLFTEYGQIIGTPAYMSPEQADGSALDIDTRTDIYSLGVLLYELLTGATPLDRAVFEKANYTQIQRMIREVEPPRPSTRISALREPPRGGGSSVLRETVTDLSPKTPAAESPAAARLRLPPSRILEEVAKLRRTDPQSLKRQLRGDLDWIVMKALEKDRARRYETASGFAADVQRYLRSEPVLAAPPSSFYRLRKLVLRNKGAFAALGGVAAALLLGAVLATYGLIQARIEQANAMRERDRAVAAEREQIHLREQADKARAQTEQERDRAVKAEGAAAASAQEARSAANRAEAINKFLLNMLGAADLRELGREARVSQALERASKTVGDAFRDQPDVEAGIRGILGSTYRSLGMLDEAEPHIQASLALNQKLYGENSAETADSLRAFADLKLDRGQLEEAEKFMRAALAIFEKLDGAAAAKVPGVQSDLANILRQRKQFDAAEAIYRRVLANQRAAAPQGREMQVLLNSLAVLVHDQERLDEAESLYREAMELGEQALGGDDPDTLTARVNLASILKSRGRWEEAEALFVETAKRMRRVFGDRHPKTATTLNGLAQLLENRGRFQEALPLYREVLEIRRSLQGDRSEDVVGCKIALANVLTALDDDAAAIALRREVLDLRRETLGEENQDTIAAMTDLGNALAGADQKTEAEPLLRRAAELAPRVLGPENRHTQVALNSLAVLLHGQGRLDEAEPLYREALEAGRRSVGENHRDTIITMHNLMGVLRERGKLDEAETLGRDVVARFERVFGPGHPNTAVARNSLARVLWDRGQLAEAEQLFQQALDIRRARLGNRHASVADTLVDLGILRVERKDAAGAEAPLRNALEMRRTALGGEHTKTGIAASALGRCLAELGRFDEAETLLVEGYTVLEKTRGSQHRDTQRTLERLIGLYEAWDAAAPDKGYAGKAAEWRARRATPPTSQP